MVRPTSHWHVATLESGIVSHCMCRGIFLSAGDIALPPSFSPALQTKFNVNDQNTGKKRLHFFPPTYRLCSGTFWNNFYEFFVLSEGEEPRMVRQSPISGARAKGHGCAWGLQCVMSWEQFSHSESLHAFGSFKIWPHGISIQITRTCPQKIQK